MARFRQIRQIAYDQTFLDQAALLQKDAPRLDEMLDGVIWEIATHAEKCEVIYSSGENKERPGSPSPLLH
jgi:hypothetical protein